MKRTIKTLFLVVLILSLSYACTQPSPFQYSAYHTQNGWGYRIFQNDQLFIDQPFIPVVAGNQPFKTEADAKKTARVICEKLKDGQLPTITLHDLQEMQIKLP